MYDRYAKELDPYQELALAEEFYTRTLEMGRNVPKDEMSQDLYQASLDEAKFALKEAKDKIARLQIQEAENIMENDFI